MTKLPPALCSLTLFALALCLLACGNSPPRHLIAATVTPAAATASTSPNGIVQFTATGTFDRSPSTAVLNPAVWELEPSNSYPPDAVSFTATGAASCKAGFVGTATVRGGEYVCPDASKLGIPCGLIFGTAQLTCP
jgi:hypothetical protein